MKKIIFMLLTSFFISTTNYGYADDSKTDNTRVSEKNIQSIDSINSEIIKLQARYDQTRDTIEKDSITKRIIGITKKLQSLVK